MVNQRELFVDNFVYVFLASELFEDTTCVFYLL